MSGVLKIHGDAVWMPANWVYDNVLELIASNVPPREALLRELLMRCQTTSLGYCDLRDLSATQIAMLTKAAEAAYSKVISDGPEAFAKPDFYPGFVKHFQRLVELLRNDPRQKS